MSDTQIRWIAVGGSLLTWGVIIWAVVSVVTK